MFRPVPMLKMNSVILEKDERSVLLELGRLGVYHLVRSRAGPDTAPLDPPNTEVSLQRCDHIHSRCTELIKQLQNLDSLSRHDFAATPGGRRGRRSSRNTGTFSCFFQRQVCHPRQPPVLQQVHDNSLSSQFGITLDDAEHLLTGLESRAATLGEIYRGLQQTLVTLHATCDRMADLREFTVPFDQLDRFSHLHFLMGSMPPGQVEKLQDNLSPRPVIIPLSQQSGRQHLILIASLTSRSKLESCLSHFDFCVDSMPADTGSTAEAVFQESQRECHSAEMQIEDTAAEIATFVSKAFDSLDGIQHRLSIERSLLHAMEHFPRTGNAVLLSGWCPLKHATLLRERLTAATEGRCIIQLSEPAQTIPVPVLLDHPGWMRPFQKLVTGFGFPEYKDIEPTVFVAISYILMFGVMFGDAGQGAILAIAGWLGMRSRRAPGIRDLGRILFLGGLSSVVFGIVYGSYFGIPKLKSWALWRDPLEGDPLVLMLAAAGVGMGLISLGLILNIINRFRRGEFIEAWLGRCGIMGALFYWGALGLLAKAVVSQSHTLVTSPMLLLLALPLLGWMSKEPILAFVKHHRGEPAVPGGLAVVLTESVTGVIEGITGYLANTTSFMRLAAYAMSHAALLIAAFTVAEQLENGVIFGRAWGVLAIILGNLVAILLEGIIAAVQALRLEYYEFFSKFFTGGGLPFAPFKL